MDSNSIIQLASALNNQQIAQQQQTAVLKLANDQLTAQGDLMMPPPPVVAILSIPKFKFRLLLVPY